MMKKTGFFVSSLALMFLYSCKEHATLGVNLSNTGAALKDTTYMASVEAATPKKVVVEEFTGASCPNCPDARNALATISTNNPDRIILLELHPKEVPQGRPVAGKSKYDFTNQYVSDIITQFYPGLGAIPQAGIDRILNNGNRLMDKSQWAAAINTRLAMASVANITLTNTYDDAKREGVIGIKVAYTAAVSSKQCITIAMLESDIEDIQEYPTYDDEHYIFKHVLRKIVSPIGGTPILDSIATKAPGRVFEGEYKYTVDAAWKPEKCHLVVFLHNNAADNKEILQAKDITVKQ